jgi:hypothetical protein
MVTAATRAHLVLRDRVEAVGHAARSLGGELAGADAEGAVARAKEGHTIHPVPR